MKTSNIPQQGLSHCSPGAVPRLPLSLDGLLLPYLARPRPLRGVSVDSHKEALPTTQLNPTQAARSSYSSGQWLLCHLQPPYFTRWCDCVSELHRSALPKPLPQDQRLFTRATTASQQSAGFELGPASTECLRRGMRLF